MSLSFVLWAMSEFNGQKFGMAGKTIASFRRNVLFTLKIVLLLMGYKVKDKRSENTVEITKGDTFNAFHIFGGKDEASQDLVQGLTAAGFFFDEVALMPESFVNQAVARCSVEASKWWFNCNPAGPFHWFKTQWIDKRVEKALYRIQFRLEDNPSLSTKIKKRYENMFSGVFYDRYILGLWVMAEGLIYSHFNKSMIIKAVPPTVIIRQRYIGVDYGQSNPTTFLLLGIGSDERVYILDEYYHSGRETQQDKSPKTYAKDFKKWLIKNGVEGVFVRYEKIFIDPSAKGFMIQLFEEGIGNIRQANNDVNKGIELICSMLQADMVRVLPHCKKTISEFGAYCWDEKAQARGVDIPIKKNDHIMDALRYIVNGNRSTLQRMVIHMIQREGVA